MHLKTRKISVNFILFSLSALKLRKLEAKHVQTSIKLSEVLCPNQCHISWALMRRECAG